MEGQTTKLSAVNLMLATIGESAVPSLPTTVPEANEALRVLEEVNRVVQTEGRCNNRMMNVRLTPDPITHKIAVSTLALGYPLLYIESADGFHAFTTRGSYLYDMLENTDLFYYPVYVNLIRMFEFEDLPEAFRNYIAVKATRVYQAQILSSQDMEKFTLDDEYQARAVALQHYLRSNRLKLVNSYKARSRL